MTDCACVLHTFGEDFSKHNPPVAGKHRGETEDVCSPVLKLRTSVCACMYVCVGLWVSSFPPGILLNHQTGSY